jgi:DNA-binding response OmpR family regulator
LPDPGVVLIAEDDPAIARIVAMLVEDAGGTPVVAHDGRQALELARCSSTPPKVMITDLMMPVLDGEGLVRAMRAEAAEHDYAMPPVILMTAASSAHAYKVGADVLLRKPFELDELDAILQRYLG